MRVFVAGGTGVIGRSHIPMLITAGHQVTAATRSPGKAGLLRSLGPRYTSWRSGFAAGLGDNHDAERAAAGATADGRA
jgi:uncharacterized protein YbjT (DUF2867 family)